MTSETEVLARHFVNLCLRSRAESYCLHGSRTLVAGPSFDWNSVLRLLAEESLGPLLYDALRDQDIAPPDVMDVLQDSYAYTARRNLFLHHNLVQVLDSLASAGIPAIVLKGAALSETVYKNIALRPMLDLDLLIRREQLPLVPLVLAASGFKIDQDLTPGGSLAYDKAIALTKLGIEQVTLDVHWHLFGWVFYSQTLPIDWFWETSHPADCGLTPALILGPEAQLLHLCSHLAMQPSALPSLLRLYDIAEVIRLSSPEPDWDLLLARAQSFDLVMSVQRIFSEVAQVFNAPIPDDVLARCLQLRASPGEVQIQAMRNADNLTPAHHFFSDLASLPSWHKRLRYGYRFALARLFSPPNYMIARYQIKHRTLLPFYYIYRAYEYLRYSIQFITHPRDG